MLPQRILGRDLFWWLLRSRLLSTTTHSHIGRRLRARADLVIGSPLAELRAAGVDIRPRVTGAEDESVEFADGTTTRPAAVVWATGFRSEYSWIDIPGVLTGSGVRHERGIMSVPGLSFIGLPWQHTRGSALLGYVKDDAGWLARDVTAGAAGPPRLTFPPVEGLREAGYRRRMSDERSTYERMLAGEPYIADDTELGRLSSAALDLMDAYNATTVRQGPLRRRLLEELLGEVGEGTEIRPPFYVDYGRHLSIGARCFANFGLTALDVAPITIGDDVQLGPHVQLLTPTHPLEPGPRREKWEAAEPIRIGNNVWLGGRVIVCPGVAIGDDTVVGAGAVVTKDLPAGVVAVGSPARVIRELPGAGR